MHVRNLGILLLFAVMASGCGKPVPLDGEVYYERDGTPVPVPEARVASYTADSGLLVRVTAVCDSISDLHRHLRDRATELLPVATRAVGSPEYWAMRAVADSLNTLMDGQAARVDALLASRKVGEQETSMRGEFVGLAMPRGLALVRATREGRNLEWMRLVDMSSPPSRIALADRHLGPCVPPPE